MRNLTLLFLLIILPVGMVQGGETHSESWYTQQWATTLDGDIEVTNPDGTRTDILTATHAIEVEFADHWTEALGQSLHYALQQERTPGIVLILRSEKDRRYAERLNCVIEHFLPGNTVRVWIQDPPVESPVTPVTAESSYVSTTHTPSYSAGWSNGYSGYSRSTDWGEVFGAIMAVILFLLFVFLILAALMAIFEAIVRFFAPEVKPQTVIATVKRKTALSARQPNTTPVVKPVSVPEFIDEDYKTTSGDRWVQIITLETRKVRKS